MARKPSPPTRQPAVLSANQIKEAIPKLERRLRQLVEVEISDWNDDIKNSLDALQKKVETTLIEIFGPDTLDYRLFQVIEFSIRVPRYYMEATPAHVWVNGYRKSVADAIVRIRTAIEVLNEKLEDMGETPGGHALKAYEGLDLHPEIDLHVSSLYRDGHYANAIEDGVKALNALVRMRSGVDGLDGSKLMERVFGPKKPILRFNNLADDSDIDEQRGYMMLFSGAVAGLRNPRAHKLIMDDGERALEFIAFISLLAKLLDGAEKVRER